MAAAGHGHGHDLHRGGGAGPDADSRWLGIALGLILAFMAVEVVVGLLVGSLALISDAGHMLSDAAAIALALVAIRLARRPARGHYTYGLKRVEILSAQANGITLVLLGLFFAVEAVVRLVDPPPVEGLPVLITALVGVVVNLAATASIARANRTSLNVEGAFQHILNDLYAFIATAAAGLVVLLTGFARADSIAALVVAALMLRAGWGLVRASARIFLEASPAGLDPDAIGARLAGLPDVAQVHDLHIWEITSGQPALSAHVLVAPGADCHAVQVRIERCLREQHHLDHTTLQVDHAGAHRDTDEHCRDPHGPVHTVEHPGTAG
jgi:cobalt-zinc-cadmium efflux system protein